MRILIIEDDEKIAELLKEGLQKAGFRTDVALDGIAGSRLLGSAIEQDLIVLDLMLPGQDGLSLLKQIRKAERHVPVIILSAKHSFDDRLEGLQSGADDYLVKPFSFPELLIRVQNLLRRIPSDDLRELQIDDLTVDLLKREVRRGGGKIELQAKEFALLVCLLKNRGVVLSKNLLLKEVWGYQFDPQTNVVDVLVCRLRGKIDKGTQVRLIHTIRGLGYVCRNE